MAPPLHGHACVVCGKRKNSNRSLKLHFFPKDTKRELYRLELEKEKLARIRRREKRHEQLRLKIQALQSDLVQDEIASTQRITLLLSQVDSIQREYRLLEARTERLRNKKQQYELFLKSASSGPVPYTSLGYGPSNYNGAKGESNARHRVQSGGINGQMLNASNYQDNYVSSPLSPTLGSVGKFNLSHMPSSSHPSGGGNVKESVLVSHDHQEMPPQHSRVMLDVSEHHRIDFLPSDASNLRYSSPTQPDPKRVFVNASDLPPAVRDVTENQMYVRNQSSDQYTHGMATERQHQQLYNNHIAPNSFGRETTQYEREENIKTHASEPYRFSSLYHHPAPSELPSNQQPAVRSYNPSTSENYTQQIPNPQQLTMSYDSQQPRTVGFNPQSSPAPDYYNEPPISSRCNSEEEKIYYENSLRKDSYQGNKDAYPSRYTSSTNLYPRREPDPMQDNVADMGEHQSNVDDSRVILQSNANIAVDDRSFKENDTERYDTHESAFTSNSKPVYSHVSNIPNGNENLDECQPVDVTSPENGEPTSEKDSSDDAPSHLEPEGIERDSNILEMHNSPNASLESLGTDVEKSPVSEKPDRINSGSEESNVKHDIEESPNSGRSSYRESSHHTSEESDVNEVAPSVAPKVFQVDDAKDVPVVTSNSYKNFLGVVGGSSMQTESDSDDIEGQMMISSLAINPKKPTFRPFASSIPSLRPAPTSTDTDSVDSVEAAIQAAMKKPKESKDQDMEEGTVKPMSASVTGGIKSPQQTEQVIAGTAPGVLSNGGKPKSSGALALKLDSDSESYGVSGGDNESEDDFDFYD